MALRGFAGFGDAQVEADRDMYADWWGQTPGQALTEELRPEIAKAEAMQAQAASQVPVVMAAKPTLTSAQRAAMQASPQGAAMPGLAKRLFVPLLVVGGVGALLMLITSSKKSK